MGFAHRRAFTLVQLLVTVGIIGVLIGLLLPAVGRLRETARRTEDLSNLRGLTQACVAYAADHGGVLPPGRKASAVANEDDYVWTNYKACWRPLVARSPGLVTIVSCASVRLGYADAGEFGKPQAGYGSPDDVEVGWIYWGGRDDLAAAGQVTYRSPKRLGERLTPSSPTLWTCWCWDSAGWAGSSVCPHVGTAYVEYPSGVPLKPPPDGLGVALTDGSASFVAWGELAIVSQANGFKLYYQP
jgi:type II secretory pathway pseudopilin PulG